MACGLSSSGLSLDANDYLYRFVHRSSFNGDGTVNSGAFSLRRDPEASVGIAKLIPSSSFDAFRLLKPEHGLAQITVEDAAATELGVSPQRDEDWGAFADAHAILTGYAHWTNKKKDEAARALRDAANQRRILCRPPNFGL